MLLLRVLLFQAFGVHTTSDDSGCTSRIEPFMFFHHIITRVLKHHISILSPLPLKKKRMIYVTNSTPKLTGLPPPLIKRYLHDKLINVLLTPLTAVKGLQTYIFADTAP